MKIKREDYLTLSNAIDALFKEHTALLKQHYIDLHTDSRVKDVEKRFRWDMFYFAVRSQKLQARVDSICQYANGDHIDTALRRIVVPAKRFN